MARAPRDYRAEYARRVARGRALGLSRSQARGHPAKGERPASVITGTPLRGAARRGAEARAARGAPVVKWSTPTAGGTRDVQTKTADRAQRAITEAANRGRDIVVGVTGPEVETTSPWKRRRGARGGDWAFSGRIPADYMLAAIADAGGDVNAALREVLSEQGHYIGRTIDAYQVKELGG